MSLIEKYESILLQKKIGLLSFRDMFSDPDECLQLYFSLKFGLSCCKACGRPIISNYSRVSRLDGSGNKKRAFRCKSCKTYIYPTAGTIFSSSSVPLNELFYLLYFICVTRSSYNAIDLTHQISVCYKTAYRIMMQVRKVLLDDGGQKMKGTVEVDEAFFGGGGKSYNWSSISTRKQPIIGMLERETKKVRLFLVEDRKVGTINKLIFENIELGSTVYTDSWRGYDDISDYYNHHTIDHSKREFVRGDVHTNGIESFWGGMKRNLRKAHIKITDAHVHLYANEAAWRHNSRGKEPIQLFNELLIRTMADKRNIA